MNEHSELYKALREDVGEKRTGFCLNCNKDTIQTLQLLNPDEFEAIVIPEGFRAWQCDECGELIEIE